MFGILAQTLCKWLKNWPQLCFIRSATPDISQFDKKTHSSIISPSFSLNFSLKFFVEIIFWNYSAHVFPLIHTHSLFHAIGRLLGKKERKPETMTFSFPSESAEKDEGTYFQFFVHFNKEAQLVCVWHQPMVPPPSPSCTSQSSYSRTPLFSPTHSSLQKLRFINWYWICLR